MFHVKHYARSRNFRLLHFKIMDLTRKQVGNLGEDIAERFLVKHRFSILDRNYRKKWGEIDIVAKKGGIIRFVEVKTVSREIKKEYNHEVFRPEDNLHPEKFLRIAKTVESYLAERRINFEWQIDAITVRLDVKNKKAKVDFIENIIL